MNPKHFMHQVARARLVRPVGGYLWRELLVRRPVERQYRLRGGDQILRIRHRTQDVGGLTEVLVNGNYDFPAEVSAALGPGPLKAVDLGANIGLFGIKLFAQRPDATLLAFEPDRANADVLERTVLANARTGSWDVVRACASTADGIVNFRSGRFLFSQVADDGDPVQALDVFPYLEDADLVKIDIEGAEAAIIRDRRFQELSARAMFLEYHPTISFEEIADTLHGMGFTCGPRKLKRTPGYGELWAWRAQATTDRRFRAGQEFVSRP